MDNAQAVLRLWPRLDRESWSEFCTIALGLDAARTPEELALERIAQYDQKMIEARRYLTAFPPKDQAVFPPEDRLCAAAVEQIIPAARTGKATISVWEHLDHPTTLHPDR